MMDKDFSPPPLNDQDLDALFASAQRDTPELDPEFLTRLQVQAVAALPDTAAPKLPRLGVFGVLSQMVAQFGGWPVESQQRHRWQPFLRGGGARLRGGGGGHRG